MLVIDDAHREAEPLRFVEHLVEVWPTLPVLVVLTACAEHARPALRARLAALAARPEATRITLAPLAPDALARTLRARLPITPALCDRIVREAAGSPVFADELLLHWLAADALVEAPGGLRLRRGAPTLPAGLLPMWRARADAVAAALDPAAQAAL
ncbi:MAG: hypothetical protein H6705_04215 [Myxococcales bacterium]|nr:hypothetical protein [Myxococcales bacterium]